MRRDGMECGRRLKEPLRAPRERIGDCALDEDVRNLAERMTASGWIDYLLWIKACGRSSRCQRRVPWIIKYE